MNNTIGLLLPRSAIYPSINFDLLGGMRAYFSNLGKVVDIKAESIGIAGSDKEIYAACERLLISGTTIVAGYVNPTTAAYIAPLFSAANALFISLDAGYHFPAPNSLPPNVFFISLDGALCCRVATANAATGGAKKIAYTSSYYDAGYRSAYAVDRCLAEEEGGITLHHITKLKKADFTLAPLENHLQGGAADAVFAAFCGDMIQDFYQSVAQTPIFEQYPVYGSSFMGEEQWLEQTKYPGKDVHVCVPWASSLDNSENKRFTETLTAAGRRATVFSLLGWDAAIVAAAALDADNIKTAIAGLEGFAFESPRGSVYLDAATHKCHAPVYDAMVTRDNITGNCRLVIVNEYKKTAEQRSKLEHDINTLSGPVSSWLNAYACLES